MTDNTKAPPVSEPVAVEESPAEALRRKIAERLALPGVFSDNHRAAHRAASPYELEGVRSRALEKADEVIALVRLSDAQAAMAAVREEGGAR